MTTYVDHGGASRQEHLPRESHWPRYTGRKHLVIMGVAPVGLARQVRNGSPRPPFMILKSSQVIQLKVFMIKEVAPVGQADSLDHQVRRGDGDH